MNYQTVSQTSHEITSKPLFNMGHIADDIDNDINAVFVIGEVISSQKHLLVSPNLLDGVTFEYELWYRFEPEVC